MAPRPLPQSWSSPSPRPTIAHYNGTLQWHPAMAPRPLPQSWSSPSPSITVHYNGTLQWHPAMAPRPYCTLQWHPGATSNPPKWFVALPPIGSKNPYSYRYLGEKLDFWLQLRYLTWEDEEIPVALSRTAWCFEDGDGSKSINSDALRLKNPGMSLGSSKVSQLCPP